MRYSRQQRFLDDFSEVKDQKQLQERIKDVKIVLVGCGGVGSVLAELLVRGGFLHVVLIDNDIVDATNLQRQSYVEQDVGSLKVSALARRLALVDSRVRVVEKPLVVDEKNIEELCLNAALIVDASDNFMARRVINGFCEKSEKDWLYTGAVQSKVVHCLFCGKDRLFDKVFSLPVKDESCCEVGVLASTTFIAASLAYTKVLQYFLGIRKKELVSFDVWKNTLSVVKL